MRPATEVCGTYPAMPEPGVWKVIGEGLGTVLVNGVWTLTWMAGDSYVVLRDDNKALFIHAVKSRPLTLRGFNAYGDAKGARPPISQEDLDLFFIASNLGRTDI